MKKPSIVRKPINVQYRHSEDKDGPIIGTTLQELLRHAMAAVKDSVHLGADVNLRVWDGDSAYGTLALNSFKLDDDFFFGELVRYEPGASLPLLFKNDSPSLFGLSQTKAPDDHEPLRGTLYFLVAASHVAIIENDLTTSRAEKYLTWLLRDQAKVFSSDNHIVLAAELQTSAGSTNLKNVDSISISPSPMTGIPGQKSFDVEQEFHATSSKEVARNRATDVLLAAGLDETDLGQIIRGNTEIQVTVQIRFKERRKVKPIEMESAQRLLRNVPEDDMVLRSKGNKQSAGRITKLSFPVNVVLKGSLLDPTDAGRALHEAYRHWVENGYIEA